jgi:hypothetical protein
MKDRPCHTIRWCAVSAWQPDPNRSRRLVNVRTAPACTYCVIMILNVRPRFHRSECALSLGEPHDFVDRTRGRQRRGSGTIPG